MSVSVSEEPPKPLTGLAWASSQPTCPKGYTMIVATIEGASANFVKGFNQKSAVYLCYSSTQESPLEQVVTDIQMVTDKTPLPVGFAYISEFIDPKVTISKKKRLCAKLLPLNNTEQTVCEIKITMKNKQLGPPYQRFGEISGLALWCKKVNTILLRPTPKPRSVNAGIRGLSLDGASLAQSMSSATTPNPPAEKLSPKTIGKSSLVENSIYDSSNFYGISAIDGIPFTIHPMFENRSPNTGVVSSSFNNFRVKTLSDIENEYNYGFVVERSAAARMPPEVC
ncbi:multivesicular body subunit 12A [Bombina bombina]|uniref:multivesicular body subunit 12A n=1 Tax=Bombina bombina TaxID=8345 RepID=UPI00235AF3E4|nr:multivesicular body subunit 12A [Bombina bombina]